MRVRMTPAMVDMATTTIASVGTALATMLVLRWLAQSLGTDGFAEYSIARRLVLTAASLTTLTMGIALPRYLGFEAGQKTDEQRPYLLGATALALGLTTAAGLLLLPLRVPLAQLAFGSASLSGLVAASLFMLWGYAAFTLAYGYYRGVGRIRTANMWQLGSAAVGPAVVVLAFRGASAASVVLLLGSLLAVAIIPVAIHCTREWRASRFARFGGAVTDLVKYGGYRAPEGIALATLLSLGPLLAPRYAELKAAGFLLAAQSVFRVVEAVIPAFGFVALPRVAQWVGGGQTERLRESVGDLANFVFQLGVFAAIQLVIWADVLVVAWLGPAYVEAIPLMRVICAALPAHLGYSMMASIINASETRPITTLSVVAALAVAGTLSFVLGRAGYGAVGLAIATSVGLFIAGLASIVFLWWRHRFAWVAIARILALNVVLGAASLGAHALASSWSGWRSAGVMVAVLFIAACVYGFALWKWRMPWIRQITTRVHVGREKNATMNDGRGEH